MSTTLPSFPAKLLLFGEYTIINGGSALAIPYSKYSGKWQSAKETTLVSFFQHLKSLKGSDEKMITKAMEERWVFQSDIPLGYGLGSSGALSAAAYDAFFPDKTTDLILLKEKLAKIESHFHGQSSGLDPLTCYTGNAIHIMMGQIKTLEPPTLPTQLTLYDSKMNRNGKPLIKYYIDRMEVDAAFDEVVYALSKFNERIINEFISGQDISASFLEISRIQFEFFQHMIPESVGQIWEEGLKSGDYSMKLSGAGGGGYFLKYKH